MPWKLEQCKSRKLPSYFLQTEFGVTLQTNKNATYFKYNIVVDRSFKKVMRKY